MEPVSVEDALSRTRPFFHDDLNQLHLTGDVVDEIMMVCCQACTQQSAEPVEEAIRDEFAAASINVKSLEDVGQAWSTWCERVHWIRTFFMDLHVYYCKIEQLGAEAFASDLVRIMHPGCLLKTGVQISPAALTLPDKTFDQRSTKLATQQVLGLKIPELREALLRHGDNAEAIKRVIGCSHAPAHFTPKLKKRLIKLICDKRRADAVAAVEAERSRYCTLRSMP